MRKLENVFQKSHSGIKVDVQTSGSFREIKDTRDDLISKLGVNGTTFDLKYCEELCAENGTSDVKAQDKAKEGLRKILFVVPK